MVRYACLTALAVLLLVPAGVLADFPTILSRPEAVSYAQQRGWRVDARLADGRLVALQAIVAGVPQYRTTYNLDAADSISTDEVWPGGSGGFSLTGAGVTLGIWDGGGVRTSHIEFEGRAAQYDTPLFGGSDHATHVAGTMIGAGRYPNGAEIWSRGGAYGATLRCYDWFDDVAEMRGAAQSGVRVSNHSYGAITGWEYEYDWWLEDWYWFWYGNVNVSTTEDYRYGYYDEEARAWDQTVRTRPYLLPVKSAGNDRDDSGPAFGEPHYYFDPGSGVWKRSFVTREPDGPYDCISDAGVAKNVLTVGAVRDVVGGYSSPGSVRMTDFSGWGPTDDGRIKPDICGNGYGLLSSVYYDPFDGSESDDSYSSYSGTSMSSPNVSGALGILIQHWRAVYPNEDDMRASTLKALVLHTADECGAAPGPDYSYGWGLMNTLRAVQTIDQDLEMPETIAEFDIGDDEEISVGVLVGPQVPALRVTICWTDPAASVFNPHLNDPTPRLVNDLDLRIVGPGGTVYYPWVLDRENPSAPATTGNNSVDNVEQVMVPDPVIGSYTVTVNSASITGGAQTFSMIVTGQAPPADCNGNGVPDIEDIANGTSSDCNINGVPDECDLDEGTSSDCNNNGIPDECDISGGTSDDCNANGLPDECEIADGTAEDCNGNGVLDVCDVADGTSPDCNGNGVPDECDVSSGTSNDVNGNGIPDECEPDCNSNGIPDDWDISTGASEDCNANAIPDECDVAAGTSPDCNGNGVPDECDIADGTSEDCNNNDVPDECDIAAGTSPDCNGNGVPDGCDVRDGTSEDCNFNNVPDECEPDEDCNNNGVKDICDIGAGTSLDCNGNWVPDECDLASGTSFDCNGNGVPDECDIAGGLSADCNNNGVPDECDIAAGDSNDVNGNGIPDECEPDCNNNGIPDAWDISTGSSADCNANAIPDECDIAAGTSADCNTNGVPDECDLADGTSPDCNGNSVPDECDIAGGTSADCNGNAIPDECDIASGLSADCNANGVPDECDLASGSSLDCNGNGVPDECDIAGGTSQDCNLNGVPDECDLASGSSLDCNGNGVPDECDIAGGFSEDCNVNGVPDECDISSGHSTDFNSNGIPDDCEPDCNGNAVPDDWDIATGTSEDCDQNGVPDECETPPLPRILFPPDDLTVCEGDAVTLEVQATYHLPLAYQWRKDGQVLSGQTGTTLEFAAAAVDDAGAYDVIVTCDCGSVTTAAGTLVVDTAPVIHEQPESVSVPRGGAVTFHVQASSSTALNYEWQKNGTPIAGATSSAYTIADVAYEDAGNYTVRVINACGDVLSETAELIVTLPAAQVPQPADGATGVSINANLKWQLVEGATAYDVHFGTEPDPPLVGQTENTGWYIPTLEYETTYYWKITPRNPQTATEGPVWSFTTADEPQRPPEPVAGPSPADGATDVPVDVRLVWGAAERALTYKVLIGTEPTLRSRFLDGSTKSTRWRGVGNLMPGTTYYWQVVAENELGSTSGPTWRFTTADDDAASDAPPSPGSETPADDQPAAEQPSDGQPDTTGDNEQTPPVLPTAACPSAGLLSLALTLVGLWTTRPRSSGR